MIDHKQLSRLLVMQYKPLTPREIAAHLAIPNLVPKSGLMPPFIASYVVNLGGHVVFPVWEFNPVDSEDGND